MNYAKHLLDIKLKLVDAKPAVGVVVASVVVVGS